MATKGTPEEQILDLRLVSVGMTETPEERISELRSVIMYHRKLYFVDDCPIIPDAQYDLLERALISMEAKHPNLITSDSPTQFPGSSWLSSYEGYSWYKGAS